MHWATKLGMYSVGAVLVGLQDLGRIFNYVVRGPDPLPAPRVNTSGWDYTRMPRASQLRTETQEIATMQRAVGYCENTGCEDYAKGVFLLNHSSVFFCPRCTLAGTIIVEKGHYTGTSKDGVFKEVRVEFNYDPISSAFKEIAIVRDESLWGHHQTYTLQSPLIKTEKRGLKVAEAILANLNRYRGLLAKDGIPGTHEVLLDFDVSLEEFTERCRKLGVEWANSPLAQNYARDDAQHRQELKQGVAEHVCQRPE